jgi:hypothetical protein
MLLKEKYLPSSVKSMVGDIEDLNEVKDTLVTCFNWSEILIAKAKEPVVKFQKYRVFEHAATMRSTHC